MSAERVRFRLYLITDRKLCEARGRGLIESCAAALSAAASMRGQIAVQLREKDLETRELCELANQLRKICTDFGAPLLINDRIDIALACDAEGVHLPAESFTIVDARRLVGPSRLIGVSTHNLDEVKRANEGGADFIVYGPVFDPISKAAYGPPRGCQSLAEVCRASAVPVYALGGMTSLRVRELAGAIGIGVRAGQLAGVGVIGAVLGADRPERAAIDLLAALRAGQLV